MAKVAFRGVAVTRDGAAVLIEAEGERNELTGSIAGVTSVTAIREMPDCAAAGEEWRRAIDRLFAYRQDAHQNQRQAR